MKGVPTWRERRGFPRSSEGSCLLAESCGGFPFPRDSAGQELKATGAEGLLHSCDVRILNVQALLKDR